MAAQPNSIDRVLEQHFSVQVVAQRLGLSEDKVRRMFQHEPGVKKVGTPGTRDKKKYVKLLIPESVLVRVCQRLAE